jgi:hypothetical protein
MQQDQERRATGVERVPVEKVVEICGREPGIPAFEAESVELSGRGMHVRTPYLPDLGAPLVCRLEDSGREVVVEGVVAWRNQTEGGGEFGIRFTALDSSSVDVLKALCRIELDEPGGAEDEDAVPEEAEAAGAAVEDSPAPPLAAPGHAVKLHIDGLGSPMKARVRRGSKRRVHVGSNLEFLKVGRNLQIEDLSNDERLAALIDGVSIAVDPETDVPQLVVTLRYEGASDTTPSPSVVDAPVAEREKEPEAERPRVMMSASASTRPLSDLDEPDEPDDLDGDDEDIDRFVQQSAIKEHLETFAVTAGRAARLTSSVLARVGATTADGVGALAQKAGKKVSEVRQSRAKRVQRRTAAAPMTGGGVQRLRPQSGSKRAAEPPPVNTNAKKKKIALATAGLGVVLAGAVVVFAGKGKDGARAEAEAAAVTAQPSAAAGEAAPATVVEPPAMKVTAAAEPKQDGPRKNEQGIVADVPLFGPTPMATMEPAPLEPPDDDIDAADEGSDVPDESFDKPVESPKKGSSDHLKAWGHGRLHLPFVHRIKLDEPGTALEGAKRSTGFTVFLPKRKLLQTGKAISRRDDRIIEVRTSNEPRGARVTFVFQGQVPAYKARLKGQYIEFFISSPAGR